MKLEGKKILVTGGHGFLGSFVYEELLSRGIDPKDITRPKSSEYDLRLRENCEELAKDHDLVIHLAANVGGIGYNKDKPGELFYDNAVMGIQLIEACRKHDVDKMLNLGTVCAYPKHTEIPFKEENLWNGYPEETNAPYGLAKKMLLVQSQAYRKQYDFNSIYLLPVNMYGPRDNFDLESSHVIPAIMRKCIEAKENEEDSITAWGTGEPTREFLYVKDCADAIVEALKHYEDPKPVNIGSGEEVSIKQLVNTIKEVVGFEGEIEWDTSKPDGQPRRCLDTSRARNEFDFEASTSLKEGLKETYNWYSSRR